MKQIIKISLVLVFVLTYTFSFSNDVELFVKNKSDKFSYVTFENVNEGSLLLIKDIDGEILYSEQIKQTGTYTKGFILTNLPNADYYFELDKQDMIKISPFKVDGNSVVFLEEKGYEIAKPEVIVKNSCVYISKEAMLKQSIKIEVYNEDYDLAFSEKLKNTQSLNRVYDFSNFKKGEYIILVKSEGRVFENKINIGSLI